MVTKCPGIILLSLISLASATSCHNEPNRLPEPAANEPVGKRLSQVAATGSVKGRREARVSAKIAGRIVAFEHDEGDFLEAGTPVARLEDRHLKARLTEAEAALAEDCKNLARVRTLASQGIMAPSELEHAEAQCARRRAEVEEAAILLDYATVRAPFSGTLIRKFKEVGEAVSGNTPADPLFCIADLSSLKVTAEVPESDIGAVRPGQTARVTADAYAGQSFAARVTRIAPAVGRKKLRSDDPRERLDEKVVEVDLALQPDSKLRSGMTVDVAILVSQTASRASARGNGSSGPAGGA